MDNFFEIIVFFVTAVIFIVSAITKQKKKAAGDSGNMDNLVESFFGIPNQPSEKPYDPVEEFNDYKQERVTNIINKEANKATEVKESVAEMLEEEEEFNEQETNPVFDIRQAVIYSEILKRKHF